MMETQSPSKKRSPLPIAFRYALILIVITAVLEFAKYFLNWDNPLVTDPSIVYLLFTLTFAISIAVVFMMIKRHRDEELGGFISFGRCLGLGILMGVIYGGFAAGWNFIFRKYMAPDIEEREEAFREMTKEGLENNGAGGISNFVETAGSMENVWYYIFVTSVLSILFFSILAGIFLKRSRLEVKD